MCARYCTPKFHMRMHLRQSLCQCMRAHMHLYLFLVSKASAIILASMCGAVPMHVQQPCTDVSYESNRHTTRKEDLERKRERERET